MNDQQLFVSIEARLAKLERDWKKVPAIVGKGADGAEKRAQRATQRIEQHFVGMNDRVIGIGKNMLAGFAGGLVAGGVMGILGRGGELARGIAEIGDEAKRAGLSLKDFQELKYVAEQNRIGIDSLVDGIKELNLRSSEFISTGGGPAADAFRRIGYDAETLKVKLRDPSALFTEIIGKLGQMDRASAILNADEIFGGTGGEKFVQLIEQGADAIYATRQEAHDLGLIMSDELVAKADELDRRFNAVANTVGSALKQAIVGATLALVDFLNTFGQLPAIVDLQARTAPLEERSLSIMQQQLADKQAALDGVLEREANGELSGWFNTGIGHDDVKSSLAAEIAELSAAIDKRLDPSQFDVAGVFEGLQTPTYGSVEELQAALSPPPLSIVVDGAGTIDPLPRAGGGRASAMRAERDAAAELIAELENELRIVGMSEVEKRVDAELRRAGAGATDAQRNSIRALVMEIENQNAAMDQMQAAMDGAKGMAKDFLGGLLSDLRNGVDGATALANAFGRLADKLLDMALDGLLNSIFSGLTGGMGGIFGFSQGGVVEAATGGLIRGQGTGTSDSIPARLSDGEFVVRASQTAKHLDLLRAINDGKIAAFATGGLVGDSPAIRAANDNIGHANDNAAPIITISAPVTVNANGGTPEANADLAKRMRREMEAGMRSVVASEIGKQMKPGNTLNTRSR